MARDASRAQVGFFICLTIFIYTLTLPMAAAPPSKHLTTTMGLETCQIRLGTQASSFFPFFFYFTNPILHIGCMYGYPPLTEWPPLHTNPQVMMMGPMTTETATL
jgi:hypothetical protein